jgi:hypothetical protein
MALWPRGRTRDTMAGLSLVERIGAVDVVVREAQPDDAEMLVAILNPAIESGRYTVLDRPFTAGEEREFILKFPARGILHVAEDRVAGPFVKYEEARRAAVIEIAKIMDRFQKGERIEGSTEEHPAEPR